MRRVQDGLWLEKNVGQEISILLSLPQRIAKRTDTVECSRGKIPIYGRIFFQSTLLKSPFKYPYFRFHRSNHDRGYPQKYKPKKVKVELMS